MKYLFYFYTWLFGFLLADWVILPYYRYLKKLRKEKIYEQITRMIILTSLLFLIIFLFVMMRVTYNKINL